MKSPFARHTAITIGIVVIVGAVLSLVFHGPGDVRAIWISGVVAVAVQLLAFALGQVAGRAMPMARVATGALLRLLTVVIYAFLAALVLKLPVVAALLSLFLFFFLSTLIEPLLIKT